MISIAKATSAEYYTSGGGAQQDVGPESYYLDAVTSGEPPGLWGGTGAQRLGLAGEVVPEDMHTLFGKFENPRTGAPVGTRPAQRASFEDRLAAALAAEPDALPERVAEIRTGIERTERQSVIGWDVTFSVPKSVTVAHTAAQRAELAAIRAGDSERAERFAAIRSGIESAIHDADRAMIAYAESLATARTGGSAGAPIEWVAAQGLTVASFFQHTSRNIDPQLHVHNVVLNRAYCADGKVRALDGADLLAQKHALGAIADRTLGEGLTRMGFDVQLRPDGLARELRVIPTEISDLFSSRSRQVTKKVAELVTTAEERLGRELTDYELHRLKQTATLATRAGKDHDGHTREELLERWWAETVTEVGRDLDNVADSLHAHLTRPDAVEGAGWFDEAAVLEEAVAAVGEKKSAWTRADLMLEIDLRLPSLGGLAPAQVTALLNRLADSTLSGDLVRQVSGLDDIEPHTADDAADVVGASGGPLAGLADDPYTRPSARLYATTDTLLAEEALRRAGIERGGHSLDRATVEAWLDEHAPTTGPDQRAAILGLAATDARLSVLVGPAGTGKSYTAGTFAALWGDLTSHDPNDAHGGGAGRVIGLATSTAAANVLRDDGVTHTPRNIDTWLSMQNSLSSGSTHPDNQAWQLGPSDVVMVDEASMVATADLHRIHALVEAAGARLVLTGDPRQLGAVEAGGVLGLVDGHAQTFTLTDVRRFHTDWEADASLALRDGDADALATYDRHGRLLAHDDTATALDAAARAAVADRLDGRSVVVITSTNEQAHQLAGRIRAELVALGQVHEDGVLLGKDGGTAGIGDLISCRQNDYTLGVTNRGHYLVTATGEDGTLTVRPIDRDHAIEGLDEPRGPGNEGEDVGDTIHLPAHYLAEHVQLGYASTVHAAQGVTVDSAHLLTDGNLDAAALYVALTRGRIRNTAHVITTPPDADLHEGVASHDERPSARVVLEDSLARETKARAATVELELDEARLSSMPLLAGRYEAAARVACRERLDRHLNDLVADGTLDTGLRSQMGADESTTYLSRVLRTVELTGGDPKNVLRKAIQTRGLSDAASVAQVLSHRITAQQGLDVPAPPSEASGTDTTSGFGIPADIAPSAADHLARLDKALGARRDQLAEQVAAEEPAWARTTLGPLPADTGDTAAARADWLHRAGIVAAHREWTGWDDPDRPIGPMPRLAAAERRASYAQAWTALGRPDDGLAVAALTDGQLRVRIRARETELAWAPPHADAALRAAEAAAETARQAAVLARAEAEHATRVGDHDRASQLLEQAAAHDATYADRSAGIPALDRAARTRAAWATQAAATLDAGERARAEAEHRGLTLTPDPEPATRAEDWAAAEQHARAADDEHRPITETDLHHPDQITDQPGYGIDEAAGPESGGPVDPAGHRARPVATVAEVSLQNTHEQQDQTDQTDQPDRSGQPPRGAHVTVPENVTGPELEAMTASTSLVIARLADRASQDEAQPAAEDKHVGRDDVREYEAGRRRRDAADLTATGATDDVVDDAGDGRG